MAGRRRALIVANDAYDHEGLAHLQSPGADADALAAALGDPGIGDFGVEVVRNEPSYEVQARVEELFADSRPDDLLLLHFSCHGLKSESGELFLAARNTRPDRLASSAVPADFVQRCMRSSRSRSIVLLLDCCYGGAFGRGVAVRSAGDANVLESFPGGHLGGGRGRAVITASSAMEYAFEGDRLADDRSREPSVFTSALVEGLTTGEADRDRDGWVSLNELYDYVFDRVRERNPHQTPSRNIEMQGELYVARSRRRRVEPLPVPPELMAAAADPNLYTRLGAVGELRSRVLSDDVAAAAGAYELLSELSRHDIRFVAEAAEAALVDAALQVDEQQVDLGQARRGGPRPSRVVRLRGPALARACTWEVSDRRILVEDVDAGLRVALDTSTPGPLSGTLTLTGPGAEVVLAVSGNVATEPDAGPGPPARTDEALGPARQEAEAAVGAAHQRRGLTALVVVAGVLSLALGLLLLDALNRDDDGFVDVVVEVQLSGYGVFRLLQSWLEEGPSARRVVFTGDGVLALLAASLYWLGQPWPVLGFWVVDGLAQVLAAVLGRPRGSARTLEVVSGALAACVGVVALSFALRDFDNSFLPVARTFGYWMVLLGGLLLLAGRLAYEDRRRADVVR